MTSLAEKEGLRGGVQSMYFDPPYGIEFGSNWQVSTRKRQVQDGRAEDATRQPEQVRAFRDTWRLGIHSYLAYLRDRLTVARDLLSETGSIFVQIGDQNVHLVRSVLDEVFGSECAVVTIVVKKKGSQKSSFIDPVNDYILWYSKTSRNADGPVKPKFRPLLERRELDADTIAEFRMVELPDGSEYPIAAVPTGGQTVDYRIRPQQLFIDHPGARLFRAWPITNGGERANQMDPVVVNGKTFAPPKSRCWSHTSRRETPDEPSGMERVAMTGRLIASGKAVDFKRYLDDFAYKTISNWWDGLGGASDPIYVVQTNPEIVRRCILMTTDPGDLVLDPTCGSGTTAVVAEQWGRRWITTDTSRVALALARARLMAATHPFYVLRDSEAGARRTEEVTGQPAERGGWTGDVRRGFVNRRAPRITSGAIANNSRIRAGMSRAEVEAAVVQGAEDKELYDQPFVDTKRVRVTGPFTVESLSPHRVLSTDADRPRAETEATVGAGGGQFETMILENLRKAGVQNMTKDERLRFDTLDPFAGLWGSRDWDVYGPGRCDEARRSVDRSRARHGRPRAGEGGRKGGGTRSGARRPRRVRVRLRSARLRGGEALRPADGTSRAHERRPRDGRRAPEENWGGEPLYRVRRARC